MLEKQRKRLLVYSTVVCSGNPEYIFFLLYFQFSTMGAIIYATNPATEQLGYHFYEDIDCWKIQEKDWYNSLGSLILLLLYYCSIKN